MAPAPPSTVSDWSHHDLKMRSPPSILPVEERQVQQNDGPNAGPASEDIRRSVPRGPARSHGQDGVPFSQLGPAQWAVYPDIINGLLTWPNRLVVTNWISPLCCCHVAHIIFLFLSAFPMGLCHVARTHLQI